MKVDAAGASPSNAKGGAGKGDVRFRSQFKKTELCAFFMKGWCCKGKNCEFAHGERELTSVPDLRKTSLCRMWLSKCCKLPSSRCPFAHGHHELHRTSVYRQAPPNSEDEHPPSPKAKRGGGAEQNRHAQPPAGEGADRAGPPPDSPHRGTPRPPTLAPRGPAAATPEAPPRSPGSTAGPLRPRHAGGEQAAAAESELAELLPPNLPRPPPLPPTLPFSPSPPLVRPPAAAPQAVPACAAAAPGAAAAAAAPASATALDKALEATQMHLEKAKGELARLLPQLLVSEGNPGDEAGRLVDAVAAELHTLTAQVLLYAMGHAELLTKFALAAILRAAMPDVYED